MHVVHYKISFILLLKREFCVYIIDSVAYLLYGNVWGRVLGMRYYPAGE